MKKVFFILFLFLSVFLFAQVNLIGKWNLSAERWDGLTANLGVIVFQSDGIYKVYLVDSTFSASWSQKQEMVFMADHGFYISTFKDKIFLIPAYGHDNSKKYILTKEKK